MSESLFERYKAALRRGHMAALEGELDDALAAYDAAAALVPERALPVASRGTVLHRLDRWPEAAEAFERALQLAPDDEASLRARATARAERGLRSGAAADFERLAFVLDVAGRAPLAADAARRAAELEPTQAREALAERLAAAAAQLPPAAAGDIAGSDRIPTVERSVAAAGAAAAVADALPDDPWGAGLHASRLAALEDDGGPGGAGIEESRTPTRDSGAYDALDALRAGLDSAEGQEDGARASAAGTVADGLPDAAAGDGAGEPAAATVESPAGPADERVGELPADQEAAGDGGAWPGIDLPSPPPPPMEGPPPDPEELIAEAALVLESGEIEAARDLLLTAARVHRDAGRIDAALDVCLNLLSIAPGEPRVHLAIANLQLDRGWTGVATEKMALLVRLTALTGDTQAAADVHGLASERLRDDPAPTSASR